MVETTAPAPPVRLTGLYEFVKAHVVVVNNLIAGGCALVGVLDFLTPRLWLLPRLVYSGTAALVAVLLAVAFVPDLAARMQRRFFGATHNRSPLWHRGGWQFAVLLLGIITVIGWASIAKAEAGGLAASQFPQVRDWQSQWLALRNGVADVKTGVDQANAKLDRIADAVDPANAADRCADLGCAIENGASAQAIRKLFDKGAKVPADALNAGALLVGAATSASPQRLDVVALLLRNGIDHDLPLLPILLDPAALTPAGALHAKQLFDQAALEAEPARRFNKFRGDAALDRWNSVAGCLMRASGGGMTLLEFAALQGDTALAQMLTAQGARFPERPLQCRWGTGRRGGAARVDFSAPGTVRIASL